MQFTTRNQGCFKGRGILVKPFLEAHTSSSFIEVSGRGGYVSSQRFLLKNDTTAMITAMATIMGIVTALIALATASRPLPITAQMTMVKGLSLIHI